MRNDGGDSTSCIFCVFSPWVGLGTLTELSMLVGLRLVVTMMDVGAHHVRTGTVEEAEQRCGQGCGKLAVAEENLHVFEPQMRREIVEVIQFVLVERIKGRVADQMLVDIPVPLVMEEIMIVVQEERMAPQERSCRRRSWPHRNERSSRPSSMRQCFRFWKRHSRWY